MAILHKTGKFRKPRGATERTALENILAFGNVGNRERKRSRRTGTRFNEDASRFSVQQSRQFASSERPHVVRRGGIKFYSFLKG